MENIYEFTETNYVKQIGEVKVKDLNSLAHQLMYDDDRFGTLQDREDFINATDTFIEVTMSCSAEESKQWLGWFMYNAIAYGKVTGDDTWKDLFLAAYDLYWDKVGVIA